MHTAVNTKYIQCSTIEITSTRTKDKTQIKAHRHTAQTPSTPSTASTKAAASNVHVRQEEPLLRLHLFSLKNIYEYVTAAYVIYPGGVTLNNRLNGGHLQCTTTPTAFVIETRYAISFCYICDTHQF